MLYICSKKWKKLLTFPHVSLCLELADILPDLSYDYIGEYSTPI